MILEVAILCVKQGQCEAFEQAFEQARSIIASMPGHVSLELQRCLEVPDRYVLLVQWTRLEDHTVGFRQSAEYLEWKRLLHHFYDPFPTVEHFETVYSSRKAQVVSYPAVPPGSVLSLESWVREAPYFPSGVVAKASRLSRVRFWSRKTGSSDHEA